MLVLYLYKAAAAAASSSYNVGRKRKTTKRVYNVYFMQSIFRKVVLRVQHTKFSCVSNKFKEPSFYRLLRLCSLPKKMHLYIRNVTIYRRDYVRKKKRKTMHAFKNIMKIYVCLEGMSR